MINREAPDKVFHISGKVLTKAISDKIEKSDGVRFLVEYPDLGYRVVDRHSYLTCLEELIPSENLLCKWKGRKITWSNFTYEYKKELLANSKALATIQELKELIKRGKTITLLCYESEWRKNDCHRSILGDILLDRDVKYDDHLDMTSAEILSYIPRQKQLTNQEILESELSGITANPPKLCYYCEKHDFGDKITYEKHVVRNHPGKLCYPSRIDLANFNIKAQGNPWEI